MKYKEVILEFWYMYKVGWEPILNGKKFLLEGPNTAGNHKIISCRQCHGSPTINWYYPLHLFNLMLRKKRMRASVCFFGHYSPVSQHSKVLSLLSTIQWQPQMAGLLPPSEGVTPLIKIKIIEILLLLFNHLGNILMLNQHLLHCYKCSRSSPVGCSSIIKSNPVEFEWDCMEATTVSKWLPCRIVCGPVMYLLDVIKMVTKMLVRGVSRSRSWISARASSWNTREWLLSRITDYEVDNGVTWTISVLIFKGEKRKREERRTWFNKQLL